MQLKSRFEAQLAAHTTDEAMIGNYWEEIRSHYQEEGRCYHTLDHLNDLFQHLDRCRDHLQQPLEISFAIWYHDIIYKPVSRYNEKRSAKLCVQRLQKLDIEEEAISRIFRWIISTKDHLVRAAEDTDNHFLLDFDLAILGSDRETYLEYAKKIRNEFSVVPTFLYRRGRRKVLEHFLTRQRIYHTDLFYDRYEQSARKNLNRELSGL